MSPEDSKDPAGRGSHHHGDENFQERTPLVGSGKRARFLSLHARYGSEVISVVGPENALLDESDSIERMLGYRYAEDVSAVGDWFRYVHPEDIARLAGTVEECRSTPGESPPVEFRIKDAQGRWRWLESRGINLPGDPEVGGVVVSTREITERKRAEQTQQESEQRLRVAFESAPMGICVLDLEGTILTANPSLCGMLGYSRDELVGKSAFELIHPEHVGRSRECVRRLLAGEQGRAGMEKRLLSRTGGEVWIYCDMHLRCRPEHTADRQPEYIVCYIQHIAGRKRAEQELRESERRFRQLFDQSVDAVVVHDVEGNIRDVNQQSCRFLGYTREELLSMKIGDYETKLLSAKERAQRERSGGTLWQRIVANEPGEVSGIHEGENRRKDGTTFPVEVKVGGVDYGGERMILSSIRNITERKRAQQTLAESEERFRVAFEEAPVGVALIGMDSRFLRVNLALCDMFGYAEEDLLSLTSYDLTLTQDHAASEEWMARQERWGAHHDTMELRFVRRDGSIIWASVGAALVEDATGQPSHWVCHYQDITERRALEERLKHQALHDPLTGLPGRELLTDRLDRALASARRGGGSVAVLFVDVDNLKLVNDSLGHEAGDRLLRGVSERLRGCLREEDTVSRFGGDEFVILLGSTGSGEEALLAARRILRELEKPLYVDDYEIPVAVSVGVASGPSPDESAGDLIRHADAAMYRAKAAGGGGYATFDPQMDREDLERLELSADLRHAIERDELRVHYQHKVDLATGGVAGWEALLRWEHPRRGMIPPGTFIPLAEETGLIASIGRWVLEAACEQARVWRERYPKEPGQFMSVNLSARQFADPALEKEIARILHETGLPTQALDLEITERVLVEDEVSEFTRIREIKELGLTFSLDDFGTGYSSLSSLKQLPVDYIKIDRSFVERVPGDAPDEAFITAMVSLARALGLSVVAEGIESEAQYRRLRELGCDYGQGYHFAPPLPVGEASRSMERLEKAR